MLHSRSMGQGEWDPATGACIFVHTERNLPNFMVTTCTDLILLAIMLSKIWQKRKAGALWKLGVFWVAGATVGELPGIILTFLDYNDAMNLLFQPISALTM
ncbi:hypothetical protein Clacol_004970 [Clathrus columnatus]|uniref:Uncharacterized protein n=1 Tax=Clathrus columnatus TaxID=1419009 RepID=A0AAV5AB88_9AGAM|nr:hypothetical protein Clacol_004970 [Clathrus columnatus]